MPAPRKIQKEFVPEGNTENLRMNRAFPADPVDDDSDPTLGIEADVMDGEYKGTPVIDWLNIQESKKNPGELYISKKGKLGATLRYVLSVEEYNAMVDRLNEVEETREAWLPVIAGAISGAENPVFRSVIVQNEPRDEANKRNKLTKKHEEIYPYIAPEEQQAILETREQITGNTNGKKKKSKKAASAGPSDEEVDATMPEFGDLSMKK